MGAAVEISTGTIDPIHLAGKHVMLGDTELGVLDGTQRVVQFDVPSGRHVVFLKDGLTTSGAVAFRVQAGHCAQITIADTDAGIFAAFFGGWFALNRAGDTPLEEGTPGAEEIAKDDASADRLGARPANALAKAAPMPAVPPVIRALCMAATIH